MRKTALQKLQGVGPVFEGQIRDSFTVGKFPHLALITYFLLHTKRNVKLNAAVMIPFERALSLQVSLGTFLVSSARVLRPDAECDRRGSFSAKRALLNPTWIRIVKTAESLSSALSCVFAE